MEFVTKREVFHNGKLRGAGETVVSNEKLDTIYPHLFIKKGAKAVSANAQVARQQATAPVKQETETPVKQETEQDD